MKPRLARSSHACVRLESLEARTVPAPWTVTTALDNGNDSNPIAGSLRWAINQVNADTDPSSTIAFDIASSGVQTIHLQSYLRPITHTVVINGYTEAGSSENTLVAGDNAVLNVVLDGSSLGDGPGGLVINAVNSTVEGLVVSNFPSSGIVVVSDGNVVRGNFIGTDATGAVAAGNGGTATPAYQFDGGVAVDGHHNLIGGSNPSDRNLISGNHGEGIWLYLGGGNTVAGNFVGTDVTGTKALGNDSDGIGVGGTGYGEPGPPQGNTIGGTAAGSRNIISGNTGVRYLGENGAAGSGIYLNQGHNTVIEGNFIGTDVTGKIALGNALSGISIGFSTGVTVGGTASGAGNLVAGNGASGVGIGESDACVVQGNKIGTDLTGMVAMPDGASGVFIEGHDANNLVGGASAGARNLVFDGVELLGDGVTANAIEGNFIGTDATGTRLLRTSSGGIAEDYWGVTIVQGAHDNQIGGIGPGQGNVIAFHGDGVSISSNAGTGNSIRGNSIFEDFAHGIATAGPGTNEPNAPVITAVMTSGGTSTVSGTLRAAANAVYSLDFYGTLAFEGVSDGQRYIGSSTVTTGADGSGSFTVTLGPGVQLDEAVTATATDPAGSTSAFSTTFLTGTGPARTITVTNTNDFGPGSLRQAIFDANRNGGNTTITFAIPTSDPGYNSQTGQFTFHPEINLPTVVSSAIINGYSQSGSSANGQTIGDNAKRLIVIDGSQDQNPNTVGLHLNGGGSTVRGLTIEDFGWGVRLDSDGNTLAGNAITDCDYGVWFGSDDLSATASGNTIGGTGLADRNLIAARFFGVWVFGDNNKIKGNYFGVDATGTGISAAAGGAQVMIDGGYGNDLGGTEPGAGNVIGAAGQYGDPVSFSITGNMVTSTLIAGNVIGTDATGQHALVDPATHYGAGDAGIHLENADATRIIGNVISGNWTGIAGRGFPNPSVIQGNRIGTDLSGTQPIPNAGDGIDLTADGSLIGGTAAGQGNIIAFNGGLGASIDSNGFDFEGNSIHDNGKGGVSVLDDVITSGTITNNTITHNGGPGVWVRGSTLDFDWAQVYGGGPYIPIGIDIQRNSIVGNSGLGIDFGAIPLDATGHPTTDVTQWDGLSDNPDGVPQNGSPVGINHGQKFPVLLSAAVTGTGAPVAGTLTATPGTTYEIEFFANTHAGHANPADSTDTNRYGEGETSLGVRNVTIGADGIGYFFATDLPPLPAGAAYLTATATNPATGDTSEFSAALAVPAAGGGITLQATTQQAANDVVAAVNGMTAPNQSVTITVDLGGGSFTGVTVNPPANVTLVFQNGTFNGHSPALTVAGGNVVVRNCTLTNATDAPTVLVTGGSLTLRNDVIQESTAYADAAIKVTGGTVDLGTAADPGHDTLNVNGQGLLIQNTTASQVTALGDTWELNGTALTSPFILVSGRVAYQTRVAPTISVTGGSFAYDEHAHPASGSVTGVNGEALGTPAFTYSFTDDNGTVHTSATPPTDPGYYAVTASYPGNDNYLPATKTATITIYYDVRTLTDLSHAFNVGRTIPIKIQLTDAAGNNVSSPNVSVWAVALYRVNADGSRTQVSLQDAGGSNPNDQFRYDAGIGGYVFNLSTKGLGAGTYVFDWMAGDDPTTHELGFKLV